MYPAIIAFSPFTISHPFFFPHALRITLPFIFLMFFCSATWAKSFIASFTDNTFAAVFAPAKMLDVYAGEQVYEICDRI
jgi:hypothetical protein